MKNIFLAWCVLSFIFVSISLAQVTTSGLSKAEGLSKSVYVWDYQQDGFRCWSEFRCHLPSKSSIQGVFGIIKTSNKLAMSIGGEYQYDFASGNATRFMEQVHSDISIMVLEEMNHRSISDRCRYRR